VGVGLAHRFASLGSFGKSGTKTIPDGVFEGFVDSAIRISFWVFHIYCRFPVSNVLTVATFDLHDAKQKLLACIALTKNLLIFLLFPLKLTNFREN